MFGLNYAFYKALALFLMPLGLALLAMITAVILLLYRRRKAALWLLIIVAGWLWLWSTPLWSNFLRGRLESQYTWKSAEQYPVADAIVVLGGGIRGDAGEGLPSLDLNSAADRELFAAQLYHAGRAKVVVVSAGTDPLSGTGVAGLAMKQFLVMLGVPAAAIQVEPASRNTIENATGVKRMMQRIGNQKRGTVGDTVMQKPAVMGHIDTLERGTIGHIGVQKPAMMGQIDTQMRGTMEHGGSILLVTSALHMPRAYWLFSRTGLRIIPAPADFEVVQPTFTVHQLLPDAGALETSARAAQEILGLWAVKLQNPGRH
jgi:uncharacterized SAM-binding protein YcdF (DUF218 family)